MDISVWTTIWEADTEQHTISSSSWRNLTLSKHCVAPTVPLHLIQTPTKRKASTKTRTNKGRGSHKQTASEDLPECFFSLCAAPRSFFTSFYLSRRRADQEPAACEGQGSQFSPIMPSHLPDSQLRQLCLCRQSLDVYPQTP